MFVPELSHELRLAGAEQRRSDIDNALSISTVPVAILTEIRLQLQRLRSAELLDREDLKSNVADAISYLDTILGPSGS